MPNPHPTQSQEFKSKRFQPLAPVNEPLAKKVLGVRLPESVMAAIEALPQAERVRWLRETLVNAAREELMQPDDRGDGL